MSGGGPSAIVVGAGALGVATADALARRGWAVTIVERYAPANARGSSGDRTRLLRLGHGEWGEEIDLWYVGSAARGIALWRELSEQEEAELLQPSGLVWLARSGDGVEATAQRRLEQAGARLRAARARRAGRAVPEHPHRRPRLRPARARRLP